MKKLFIIPALLLFLTGCAQQKVLIRDIKNDKNLGKTFTVAGGVQTFSLDNNKNGVLKILDETGSIYILGNSGIIGPFSAIYDSQPTSGGQPAQYYVDQATGILKKGLIGNTNDYYIFVNDPANISIREEAPARILVPVNQPGSAGSVKCYWRGLQKFCN